MSAMLQPVAAPVSSESELVAFVLTALLPALLSITTKYVVLAARLMPDSGAVNV